jgi:hypothetical protein
LPRKESSVEYIWPSNDGLHPGGVKQIKTSVKYPNITGQTELLFIFHLLLFFDTQYIPGRCVFSCVNAEWPGLFHAARMAGRSGRWPV